MSTGIFLCIVFIIWCAASGYAIGWPMILVNPVIGWFFADWLVNNYFL